jgi:hypothetical protein
LKKYKQSPEMMKDIGRGGIIGGVTAYGQGAVSVLFNALI